MNNPAGVRVEPRSSRLLPSLAGLSPIELGRRFTRHRYLLRQLVWKNLGTMYRGSIGGLAWMMLRPLFLLAIFGFCFGVVYRSRFFPARPGTDLEFALALFIGLAIFTVAGEMLSSAPSLIAANVTMVKRVVFPLDLLVTAQLGTSLAQLATSTVVFLAVRISIDPPLGLAALAFPLVLVPYVMMTLGLAWFLASLGVFLRDIQQIVPLGVTGLMFLSPLFYPVSAVPDVLRSTIYLNPLTFVLETSRNALFLNQWPDWRGVFVYSVVGAMVMWLGWVWFEKTKKGFADVL